ncbi:hypothetical protein WICPIJ_002445 [Wickerhamomyces pijperi]|uniref:Uncharacterized protein n=1 Tax=Wickerhamomyces pijperi TaxID=599730 RepID=A0A9P8QBP4_WICPI|nr:hypothetical protein WICPIJ_002445 [Wickerhamomyces pijperi]
MVACFIGGSDVHGVGSFVLFDIVQIDKHRMDFSVGDTLKHVQIFRPGFLDIDVETGISEFFVLWRSNTGVEDLVCLRETSGAWLEMF